MKIKSLLFITFLVVLLFNFTSCNKLENLSNSGSKLILWSLNGEDSNGTLVNILLSDVLLQGSIFNDNAVAQVSASLLDPTQDLSTFYQNVIIDQIDIQYTRSDGLNIEGIDVPFGFSQKVHFLVEISNSSNPISFIMVQHNAKIESPLVELVYLGQEHVLKLEASVTFHSKDTAGNRLEPVVGYLSIWCSNFADPEAEG
jgi:hypothetical protein